MVQSILRVLHPSAKVSDLIDGDTRWWNKTMLENLFSSEEVHLIQSLPVSNSDHIIVAILASTVSWVKRFRYE
jgi:hypothetical protein